MSGRLKPVLPAVQSRSVSTAHRGGVMTAASIAIYDRNYGSTCRLKLLEYVATEKTGRASDNDPLSGEINCGGAVAVCTLLCGHDSIVAVHRVLRCLWAGRLVCEGACPNGRRMYPNRPEISPVRGQRQTMRCWSAGSFANRCKRSTRAVVSRASGTMKPSYSIGKEVFAPSSGGGHDRATTGHRFTLDKGESLFDAG